MQSLPPATDREQTSSVVFPVQALPIRPGWRLVQVLVAPDLAGKLVPASQALLGHRDDAFGADVAVAAWIRSGYAAGLRRRHPPVVDVLRVSHCRQWIAFDGINRRKKFEAWRRTAADEFELSDIVHADCCVGAGVRPGPAELLVHNIVAHWSGAVRLCVCIALFMLERTAQQECASCFLCESDRCNDGRHRFAVARATS